MTTKKVSGIIIVVLGAVVFLIGVSNLYLNQKFADIFWPKIKKQSAEIKKPVGKDLLSGERELKESKAAGVIASLLGLSLSFLGTVMIRTPNQHRILYDDLAAIELNEKGGGAGWKL
jgi:hypothetical protein